MFTHVSSTQCNHQHCPHIFPMYVVNNQLQVCIHPCSDDVKRQWQRHWYHLPIQNVLTCKQPVITWGEIWRVGRMYQHLPVQTLHQILHITMAVRCCIVLEQNDTMLKPSRLFIAKSPPHLTLAIDGHTNWHGMIKPKCISAKKQCADSLSTLTAPSSFLPRWCLGTIFLHKLFISPSCWWGYGKNLLERFSVFHVAFVRRRCWGCTAKGIILSLPGHSPISKQFHMKKHASLNFL